MRSLQLFLTLFLTGYCSWCSATNYNVGPGQPYQAIGDVPWESLVAGDTVYIHWRNEEYKEKWVISRTGTADAPIVVSGVAGPDGQLPVIDGRDATTRRELNYWNEGRSVVKVGGSNIPDEVIPTHIIIENLDIRSARPPYTFTNDSGGQETYSSHASSIHVEIGEHITIRNCIIRDSANGIFVSANSGRTRDILIESNSIHDNGIVDSIYHHNTYTAAIGITYQYNFMGALREGARGTNLKDRSAGLVVRYNWIENGSRQLDLVDAEDSDVLVNHPSYHKTYVYGNILKESEGEGNNQMVHYGGDSGNEAIYRKGTLFFYNNTLISTRPDNTTMLRLSSNDEYADVHNNIIYPTATGNRLALLSSRGQLQIRNNWIKTGWRTSHDSFSGTLTDDGSNLEGDAPGFLDFTQGDYHLEDSSPCRNSGLALHPDLLTTHPLNYQYKHHRQKENRDNDGSLDLGAFEIPQVVPGDVDGNGTVALADAIVALQILANPDYSGPVQPRSDVDGDSKIGLQEVLFVLHQSALEIYQPVTLQSSITTVQPMTGIVLWDDSPENASASIQLEYKYIGYGSVVTGQGVYNWTPIETFLNQVTGRGHQGIIRMYFVYPGQPTTVPQYLKDRSDYSETSGVTEGQTTWFPDWTNSELQTFVLDFYTAFAERYDSDPRLAFLQVGFGLWAEYHIYDGPMILGETFPDKQMQTSFLNHLGTHFSTLKWSISIDAADGDISPFASNTMLLNLGFGLFDDSFLHETHHQYNADCFSFFSYQNRMASEPMGGELSYYTSHDQETALNPSGPYGISFEQLAGQYHISYMIGNDQPLYQTMTRIRDAGMATGYRFRITSFETSAGSSRGVIENIGVAPIYYNAYVTVNGTRSGQSLRRLLPGSSLSFTAGSGGAAPEVTIECDRLVTGQKIEFIADLSP